MDLKLKGNLALITGSTKGIGLAAAELLAAEGARVIVHGRSAGEAAAVARRLGPDARSVSADLASAEETASLVTEVRKMGALDILVNNAGIFEPKDFFDIPDADWLRFYEINVLSGVRLSRAFMPDMLKRNWGRIIFISSESGIQIPAEMIHYGMTKTAQLAVARGLAELTKGTAVTVNSILPGPTLSHGVGRFVEELSKSMHKTKEEFERETFFKEARPSSLLQRFADPREVANLIAYVSSPLASATNGASLRVDGGVVRAIV